MNMNAYQRAYEATMTRQGNPNPSKSFKAWQKDAAVTHRAMAEITRLYETDRAKILAEYSTTKAAEMLAESQNFYMECCRRAENDLKDKLTEVINSKRDALRKASKAPTDEDIRLLQALKMRSKLTEAEIIYAAEAMSDNLPALGTLADIANEHGIYIPIPTAADYEEQINKAEQYALDMVGECHLPDNQLSYKATEFYNYADSEGGFAAGAFSELDNSVFTAEQLRERIETAKLNTSSIVNSRGNAAEITLKDGDSLACIATQFGVRYAAIEDANPGKDLNNLHAGDKVIIPGGKMKLTSGRGFVSPDQVRPVQMQTEQSAEV